MQEREPITKQWIEAAIVCISFPVDEEKYIIKIIKDCYNRGFTMEDTIRYAKHTEHSNPWMPEDVGLKVLNEISAKYPIKKPI